MITIEGISPINGPAGPKPPDRPEPSPPPPAPAKQSDTVEISAASSGVAAAQQAVQDGVGSQIRQEQVEAAKQRLAEGTYKVQIVVLQVAARIAALVD
jgi:hypothetical protein